MHMKPSCAYSFHGRRYILDMYKCAGGLCVRRLALGSWRPDAVFE